MDIGESIVWTCWLVRPRGVVESISMVDMVVQAIAANRNSILACGIDQRRETYLNGKQSWLDIYR